jgi:hypothetical protein
VDDFEDGERRLYAADILAEIRVTPRCLHKWITAGTFPSPDLNSGGRRVWYLRTIRKWRADCAAGGQYTPTRRPPGAHVPEPTGMVSVKPSPGDVTDIENVVAEILAARPNPPRARPRRHAPKAGVLEAAAQRKQESSPT